MHFRHTARQTSHALPSYSTSNTTYTRHTARQTPHASHTVSCARETRHARPSQSPVFGTALYVVGRTLKANYSPKYLSEISLWKYISGISLRRWKRTAHT